MSDLTGFLLARIAEDEFAARLAYATEKRWVAQVGSGVLGLSGAAVLAECEAKRGIVEQADGLLAKEVAAGDASALGAKLMHEIVSRYLALPYAGHPDYREEWRP